MVLKYRIKAKIKYVISFLFIIYATTFLVNAGDKTIKKYSFSAYYGLRNVKCDSFPNSNNLDFMNYLYVETEYPEFAEYDFIGFSAHLWFKNNWDVDIKLAMFDDFIPDNINISAQYFPFKFIGFNMAIYGYPQTMENFDYFHKINEPDYYTYADYRQRNVYELGLLAGPVLKFHYRILNVVMKLNFGINELFPFSEDIHQKQIDANYRRKLIYETNWSSAFFFFPETELEIDCFKISGKTFGVRMQSNWFTTKRSIDYTKTVFEWTEDNSSKQIVKNPKHQFSKFEYDFGVFLRL